MCRLLLQYGYPFAWFSSQTIPTAALTGNLEMLHFLLPLGHRIDKHGEYMLVCQRVHQQGRLHIYSLLLGQLEVEALQELLMIATTTGNLSMAKHLSAYIVGRWEEKDRPKHIRLIALRTANAAVKAAILAQVKSEKEKN
jgi:hypothetical protein